MNTLERKEQFTKAKMTLYTNEGHSEQRGCLDEDEKGRNSIRTLGGSQGLLIVNESGLYSLILRSCRSEGKAFELSAKNKHNFSKHVAGKKMPARKMGRRGSSKKIKSSLGRLL